MQPSLSQSASPPRPAIQQWHAAVHGADAAQCDALAGDLLASADRKELIGHIAYYLLEKDQPERALPLYEEILLQDPANDEARFYALRAALRLGRLETARPWLEALRNSQNLPDDQRGLVRQFHALLNESPGDIPPRRWANVFLRHLMPRFDSPCLGWLSLAAWSRRGVFLPRSSLAKEAVDPALREEAEAAISFLRGQLACVAERHHLSPRQVWKGSTKIGESVRLYQEVRRRKPRVLVQVGVFAGYSACLLAEACRRNGHGVIHCVDPDLPHRGIASPLSVARELADAAGLATHLRFTSGAFSTPVWPYEPGAPAGEQPVVGPAVLRELGAVDFFFIDGDHCAASTLADLVLATTALADEGVMLLHDTLSFASVRHAVGVLLEEARAGQCVPHGRCRLHYEELGLDGIDGLGRFTLRTSRP